MPSDFLDDRNKQCNSQVSFIKEKLYKQIDKSSRMKVINLETREYEHRLTKWPFFGLGNYALFHSVLMKLYLWVC